MGIKRIVDTSFWQDERVVEDFTQEEKLFFLYLLTNPHTTQLGIYKILISQMAFEIRYTEDVVTQMLKDFESKYDVIKYSYSTREIAIKNYLKYAIIKGGKPVYDLLVKEVSVVKDKGLIDYIMPTLASSTNPTVIAFCLYLNQKQNENQNQNDNHIHNDNENEKTLTRYGDTIRRHDTSTYRTVDNTPNDRTLFIRKGY